MEQSQASQGIVLERVGQRLKQRANPQADSEGVVLFHDWILDTRQSQFFEKRKTSSPEVRKLFAHEKGRAKNKLIALFLSFSLSRRSFLGTFLERGQGSPGPRRENNR